MKNFYLLMATIGLVFTTGCHAHKADQVVVVKKPHKTKVILVDNQHQRSNYRLVYNQPKKSAVCKKHRNHWHCH